MGKRPLHSQGRACGRAQNEIHGRLHPLKLHPGQRQAGRKLGEESQATSIWAVACCSASSGTSSTVTRSVAHTNFGQTGSSLAVNGLLVYYCHTNEIAARSGGQGTEGLRVVVPWHHPGSVYGKSSTTTSTPTLLIEHGLHFTMVGFPDKHYWRWNQGFKTRQRAEATSYGEEATALIDISRYSEPT